MDFDAVTIARLTERVQNGGTEVRAIAWCLRLNLRWVCCVDCRGVVGVGELKGVSSHLGAHTSASLPPSPSLSLHSAVRKQPVVIEKRRNHRSLDHDISSYRNILIPSFVRTAMIRLLRTRQAP